MTRRGLFKIAAGCLLTPLISLTPKSSAAEFWKGALPGRALKIDPIIIIQRPPTAEQRKALQYAIERIWMKQLQEKGYVSKIINQVVQTEN